VTHLQALADERVTNIVLVGDYNLGTTREFDALMGSPFPVNRCASVSQGCIDAWRPGDISSNNAATSSVNHDRSWQMLLRHAIQRQQ
jgi:hypothetical protein